MLVGVSLNDPIIPIKITKKEEVLKPQGEWTPLDTKNMQNNAKAIYILYCA